MNNFINEYKNEKIADFRDENATAGGFIAALFEHHTISPGIVNDLDEEMVDEIFEIKRDGTWGELNEWIENNF